MPPDLLRSAALIEGLRLDEPLPIGALVVEPVPLERGFAGRELRQTFNDLLSAHGFVSTFDRPGWAMQLAPRRRLAFVATPPVEVEQVVPASMEASRELGRLVDALALTHGGAPRIFAAANEFSSDEGQSWRTLALMTGSGTYPGNVLERLLPDGENLAIVDPRDIWVGARSSPLIALWLSSYRGISAEPRWDVRVLRACSLLEAIGRERIDRDTAVVDTDGEALREHDGRQATAGRLRGLLYVLVSQAVETVLSSPRVLLAHDQRSLWQEVGVWADIRNMVGHEGQWLPPPFPSTLNGPQQRSAAALELAGRGDGYEGGAKRYCDAVVAGTEVVLRSLVLQEQS
ncbi:MAG TPA: hypothetical protein VFN18_12140 [Solirubrobacterales bacterium]|nr:hypothetical protein [Solirubrobacterales bacterium]